MRAAWCASVLSTTLPRLQKHLQCCFLMLFIECENGIQESCSSASSTLCSSSYCLLFVLASSPRCHFRETLSRHSPHPLPLYPNRRLFGFHIHKETYIWSEGGKFGRARIQSWIQAVLYLECRRAAKDLLLNVRGRSTSGSGIELNPRGFWLSRKQ